MFDEDEDRSRIGPLSFDFYDNINLMSLKTVIVVFNNAGKMKLAKHVAIEPLFVVDHLLSHVFEEVYGLRRCEDSVTIVNNKLSWKKFSLPSLHWISHPTTLKGQYHKSL